MSETLSDFLGALGLSEEPYGIFYTDIEPTGGFVPAVNQPLSLELERQGKVNYQEVFANFSCVLGKLWIARKKKIVKSKVAWGELPQRSTEQVSAEEDHHGS